MKRAILFDIDQTLLYTGGAGLRALRQAFREVFRLPAEAPVDLDLAGATDSGLLDDFRRRHGFDDDASVDAEFYSRYLELLEENLPATAGGRVLPGVLPLLEALASQAVVSGLLTGNLRRGAEIKLRYFGLDGFLDADCGAYGDDHADRDRLGPLALRRTNEKHGLALQPAQVVVVGDTPRDIRCARALGASVLAVGTGQFTVEDLAVWSPEALFADLSDTGAVLEALGRLTGPA